MSKTAEREFKSWGDLSIKQRREFAATVRRKNIHGWDELKQAAWDFGFEPTEDMPSVYELEHYPEFQPRSSKKEMTKDHRR